MRYVKLEEICFKGVSSLRQKDTLPVGDYPVYGASGICGYLSGYQHNEPYVAVVKDGAGVGRVQLCSGKSSVLGTLQALLPKDEVSCEYLYEVVRSLELGAGFTGSTIPHIYFKDYKNRTVVIYEKEQQTKITTLFTTLKNVVELHKCAISFYDELVKSRFVEMFGNADSSSANFNISTINEICSSIVRGPFGSALKKEFFIPRGVGTYKVYEQKHAIRKRADIGTYYISKEKFDSLKRFECKPGDILMSCSGTMGELYQLPMNCEPGIINQALCKFTLNEKILPEYFFRFMSQVVDDLGAKGSGIKNVSSVKYIKDIKIPLPPLSLQQEFAAFVHQVDKLKFETQQSIEKLQMLYDSLAQEYFAPEGD